MASLPVRIIRKIKKEIFTDPIYAERIPVFDGNFLENRTALITGASEGLGYGIANAFSKQKCKIILTGRSEEKLKRACTQIGGSCAYIVWDAADIASIGEHFQEAIGLFGRIDILVNNAGYNGNHDFWSVTEQDYDSTFDVNVKNVFFLSQAAAAYMRENQIKGNILNISSASSVKPAWSPYEISKWACRGFTRGLAREAAPYGIIVNGIAPGPSATPMTKWSEGDPLNWDLPKGRLAVPEEIGNLAVYLCSDFGRNIVGETVFCDGGSGFLTVNK